MKRILKSFFAVLVLLAVVYAAAPLWLPYVLARQLPAGWQLETLETGYPGPSGIRLKLIRVNGALGPAPLTLAATDLDFEYRSLNTKIGTLAADVFMPAGASRSNEPLSPNDLSFPALDFGFALPRLSINRVDVTLHFSSGMRTANDPVGRSLGLDLEHFELTPGEGGGFQLASQLGFEDSLRFTGMLAAEAQPGLVNASLRFPSGAEAPWLDISFMQNTQQAAATTRIGAVINADAANRDWLDSVLARATRRTASQVGGQLRLEAVFAGRDRQALEQLNLTAGNLLLLSDMATLKVDAELAASRADEAIAVSLASPALIEYQGPADWIDELLDSAVPGLQVPRAPQAAISAKIGAGGTALVSTSGMPHTRLNADIDIEVQSGPQHLTLKSSHMLVEMADIRVPGSATADGVANVDWAVDEPFAYTADGLNLKADKLLMEAEVSSRAGRLTSKGSGALTGVNSVDPAVTAGKMDLAWEALDLETLTGKLSVKTQGFSTRLDGQAWTGFELDTSLDLLDDDGVSGAGSLVLASGPVLPLEFTGNTQTMRWDIRLAPATVKFAKLRSLLSVAGVKLPAAVKMTEGDLDLQGDVQVADEITAKLVLGGRGLVASMHNSRIVGAGFTFEAGYDRTPRASGPLTVDKIELAGGIDLKQIRVELELQDVNRFELKNLYAEAFDGRIEFDSLRYSDAEIADTTVRFTHADLGRLLAYADVDGLQGTGTLDITLPVGSDKTGIHVKNGTFVSSGGGRLAYTKQGVAGSNIGLKALENFHYKSLSGTLDYQSDGNYLMNVRLEGSNPDLYGGHPVVFNLNINGSLPALFEAMFVTGSFEESILKEIKKQ